MFQKNGRNGGVNPVQSPQTSRHKPLQQKDALIERRGGLETDINQFTPTATKQSSQSVMHSDSAVQTCIDLSSGQKGLDPEKQQSEELKELRF